MLSYISLAVLVASFVAPSAATPPACLLACAASVVKSSPTCNQLNDVTCVCNSEAEALQACLSTACPEGVASKASSAFKSVCTAATAKSSATSSAAWTAVPTAEANFAAASGIVRSSGSAVKSSAVKSSAVKSSAVESSAVESSAVKSSAKSTTLAKSTSAAASSSAAHSASSASNAAGSLEFNGFLGVAAAVAINLL
ncbi:hypothetical protein PICMEDRAFT_18405 [Pichia membranifaciens NRRL Y-2026]|uniref:CFEM domain-containing protein n=1 Tax=Pichia membranifaciens NRRL Y-2026 TaxID=763406 RepID=A0A1E3NEJ7_9ASCO|nr:hypothetical protein PICMEDRAFT_18405 [Pichia membranifaciens NRRL Y-2026]ODQ44516.1 hypothetical protein PICMEDRAFT_18405 [Pichia membranifaciens NRRL Y-2026]